jgi:hypothetical protein
MIAWRRCPEEMRRRVINSPFYGFREGITMGWHRVYADDLAQWLGLFLVTYVFNLQEVSDAFNTS